MGRASVGTGVLGINVNVAAEMVTTHDTPPEGWQGAKDSADQQRGQVQQDNTNTNNNEKS
jgi:ribosomal protein S3